MPEAPRLFSRARARIDSRAHVEQLGWRHGALTGVSLAVIGVSWWLLARTPWGCENLQPGASYAGSSERFADYVSGIHGHTCNMRDLRSVYVSLIIGGVATAVFAVALCFLLWLWWPRGWVTSRFANLSSGILAVPIIAALADIAENVVTGFGVGMKSGSGLEAVTLQSWAARMLPVFAWIKLLFYGVAMIALVVTLVGAWNRRKLGHKPDGGATWLPPEPQGLGICCSGGGIRAGAIALGAMGALEAHDPTLAELPPDRRAEGPNLLNSAHYISSVSGGGYTVGAWRIATGARPFDATLWPAGVIGDPFLADYDDLPPTDYDSRTTASTPSLYRHIQTRREFLRTGRGGLPLSVLTALGFLLVHIAVLLLTLTLIAWPLGRLARMWPINGGIGCAAAYPQGTFPKSVLLSAELCPSPKQAAGTSAVDPTDDSGVCHAKPSEANRPDTYLQHSSERTVCFLTTPGRQMPIRWGLLAPSLILAGLGVAAFTPKLVKWRTTSRRRWSIASNTFFGAAAFFAATLVGVPLLLDVVYPTLRDVRSAWSIVTFSGLGGVFAVAQRFVAGRLKRSLNLLGSVLLALSSILIGLYIAGHAALGTGLAGKPLFFLVGGWPGYVLLTAFVLALYSFVNPQTWSLNTLYRNRIRGGFATSRLPHDAPRDLRKPRTVVAPPLDGDGSGDPRRHVQDQGEPAQRRRVEAVEGRLYPFRMLREPTLDHYAGNTSTNTNTNTNTYTNTNGSGTEPDPPGSSNGDRRPDAPGPIHLVCCSAARSARTVTGVPSLSFVIDAEQVTLYEPCRHLADVTVKVHEADTRFFLDALAQPPAREDGRSLRDRHRRRLRHAQGTTSAATTVSGAAFASSMGRFGRQYPTALFAALNLRLGVWLPNPRYLKDKPQRFPGPNLLHLLKELTGAWHLDDHHLYVSDGGHRENLGLVELLRQRCRFIFCIDASGDMPGSFTTLRQAAELARTEARSTIDLAPINNPDPARPVQPHTVLSASYKDRDSRATPDAVRIVHLRPIIYPALRDELVAYAAEDGNFPHYSTGNQFLTDSQFRHLVQYGWQAMTDTLDGLDGDDRARLISAATQARRPRNSAAGRTGST